MLYTSTSMATVKRWKILSFGDNVEQMEFSCTVDRSVNCSTTLKTIMVAFT